MVKNHVSTDTELAQAVDVMIARAKRTSILIIKVNKLFSSFPSWCFLKEIENMFSMFLSGYRNTCESLRELKKAVETLACERVPTAFLVLPNFYSCFFLAIRLFALNFYRVIVDEGAARVSYHAIEIESK